MRGVIYMYVCISFYEFFFEKKTEHIYTCIWYRTRTVSYIYNPFTAIVAKLIAAVMIFPSLIILISVVL